MRVRSVCGLCGVLCHCVPCVGRVLSVCEMLHGEEGEAKGKDGRGTRTTGPRAAQL